METIMVFCAHSDDELVGLGGTLLKYASEGKRIVKVIFSYGEMSHPHLKKHVIVKERIKETKKASKVMGIKETIFLGLKDSDLKREIKRFNIKGKVKRLVKKYRPGKIFITSAIDLHRDHRAVNNVVLEVLKEMKYKGDVYSYEVWNVIDEEMPYMYEDISDYFKRKLTLIKQFESQKRFLYPLLLPIIYRSIKYGRKSKSKYAEKFYKVM